MTTGGALLSGIRRVGELTSFVAGLSTHARAVLRPAESCALEVLLEPWTAFTLFGSAMDKITDSVVAPGPVLGTRFRALHGALATATSWPERFALLDRTLSGWSTTGQTCSPELVRAWRTMRRTGGTVPIQHLAQQSGWCWRRLDYRFRQQIGLGREVKTMTGRTPGQLVAAYG